MLEAVDLPRTQCVLDHMMPDKQELISETAGAGLSDPQNDVP